MSAISVRPLVRGDMATLAALYGASFDEPFPEPVATSLLLTPGAWGLLAVEGSGTYAVPAGFLIARVILDEAEILSVGTHPERRRRGVAQALLAAAAGQAAAAGARILHLEVGEDNPGAIALYRRTGFAKVGRRPDYYRRADRRRVAALLMSMPLKLEQ